MVTKNNKSREKIGKRYKEIHKRNANVPQIHGKKLHPHTPFHSLMMKKNIRSSCAFTDLEHDLIRLLSVWRTVQFTKQYYSVIFITI